MDRPLRILHLEDDPTDADLIAATLAGEGFVCEATRVASRAEFLSVIDGPWDLILADYALPGFDGVSAQQIARERRPDLPFVFVSGTMGEEVAIDRLKAGATDYVLKQRLGRLPAALRRALQEAAERRERRRAEAEVRRLNAELERRVADRTAELEAANRALEQRERELQEAKDFLEHLLSASPSMVFRFEPDGLPATYVSPNIGWLLGYTPEEIIGVSGFWEEIIHPDDRNRVIDRLQYALEHAVAQIEQEYRLRSKDGRYRWFFNLLRIEYDMEARPVAILGYALDIADRKAAEEEVRKANAFLDSIVENLPGMMFVKDARTLEFVRFNRAGEELLGVRRDHLINKTDRQLFAPEVAAEFEAADRDALRTGAIVDIPVERLETKHRGTRLLHTKKIPISDASGKPQYLLGISEDITERLAAEQTVGQARLEAERANRAKSDFLSRMSHDLRTPLNAIIGFAQLLEMETLPPPQLDSVHQILKGGRHLLDMINEVLDIARIEAGHLSLSPEPVQVSELAHQVVGLLRPLAESAGISLKCEIEPPSQVFVRADRQRLRQVLLNLVSNAVKYTPAGGSARVTVTCPDAADVARIEVADTGPGIPAAKLNLLFQPFERLGAEQGPIEGTGLGLAVTKGLTEAMGGSVQVTSAVGRGSTFSVTLPRSPSPGAQLDDPVPVHTAAPEHASGAVLYIEDNQSNVRLLERVLARRPDVRLITAPQGAAGIALARQERPGLVLLDLHLPDMRGEDVLSRLQSYDETRNIPIVILSADATNAQTQRLLAAGAVAYVTKPLDVAKLLRLIDERLPPTASAGHQPA